MVWAIFVILLILGGWICAIYNRLRKLRHRLQCARHQIEAQLQRRSALASPDDLLAIENMLAFHREGYNDLAMLYNLTQQEFPTRLFSTLFGHTPVELY